MQAKKKNRKNAKAQAEKRQAVDEDDAVLEAALGEKQRLLTAIERKREELLQSNAASKKELELLAKNLQDAKEKSEELAELKARKEKEAEAARLELAASVERAKAQELAAAEAKAYGWGGIKLVVEATKISNATVHRGLKELETGEHKEYGIRKKVGAGSLVRQRKEVC